MSVPFLIWSEISTYSNGIIIVLTIFSHHINVHGLFFPYAHPVINKKKICSVFQLCKRSAWNPIMNPGYPAEKSYTFGYVQPDLATGWWHILHTCIVSSDSDLLNGRMSDFFSEPHSIGSSLAAFDLQKAAGQNYVEVLNKSGSEAELTASHKSGAFDLQQCLKWIKKINLIYWCIHMQ